MDKNTYFVLVVEGTNAHINRISPSYYYQYDEQPWNTIYEFPVKSMKDAFRKAARLGFINPQPGNRTEEWSNYTVTFSRDAIKR